MAMARALLPSLWPGCMYVRFCPFFCVVLDIQTACWTAVVMYRVMSPTSAIFQRREDIYISVCRVSFKSGL